MGGCLGVLTLVNVSLRPIKARDHHHLHRSLAHLLQQWPVAENRGKSEMMRENKTASMEADYFRG